MNDVSGNRVKEVRVSEASRKDARGLSTRNELLDAIAQLEEERAAHTARQRQIQSRLTEIRNSIRGRHLLPSAYHKLTDEQSALVVELNTIGTALSDIHTRLNRLRRDLDTHKTKDRLLETN